MKILLFISLFFFEVCKAQLFIINDKDGYTNVREEPNQNSKIIGKIIENQVFAIDSYVQDEENKSNDWIAIKFPIHIDKKSNFLKFEGEEKTGYVHKSRLVELENLPKFEKNEMHPNKVIHQYKDVEVIIETQAFKRSDHKISQSDEGFYLIDGEKAFPYYGGETTEIKSIVFKSKDKTFISPKNFFKNLLMVNAENTSVYRGNNDESYLLFDAGDGADSYNIILCIKDYKLFSRTITSTIP